MKNVLIIEDDPQTQEIYADKLKIEGFGVFVVALGDEGLAIAREKRPDLIVLDIMLPGKLNGFDVLEDLKKDKDLKKIPVLVLTNLGTEEKVAKEIGAVEYIIKANTSLEEVVDKIKSILK